MTRLALPPNPWPTVSDFFQEERDLDVSNQAAGAWAAFFRRNKVPLLSLTSSILSPAWQSEVERDREAYEEQRHYYVRVRNAWAQLGIECLAIKSGGTYPSLPYTSDNMDLLVRPEHRDRAAEILQDLGYVWLQNIDEPHKLLFRLFHAGRSVSAIHLHTWIGWEVEFMEDVWPRASVSPDDPMVMVPSPEDALLINAAHAFFENKRINLYDLERIRRQWQRDLDWPYIEGVARRRGWLDGLYFSLALCAMLEEATFEDCPVDPALRSRWLAHIQSHPLSRACYESLERRPRTLPFKVPFLFSKWLYYLKVARDSHDSPQRRLLNSAQTLVWGLRLKGHINPQAGLLVSFSGIDGSGKSTQVSMLTAALETAALSHASVWNRRGCGLLYRGASRLVRHLARRASSTASTPASPAPPPRGGLIWCLASVLDLLTVYNLNVRLRLLRGDIVVTDRYTADAATEIRLGLARRRRLAEPFIWLLKHLSPRPDLAFLLDAEPDDAAARALDPEDRRALRHARRLLRFEAAQSGMQVIPPDGASAAISDTLVTEVLRSYYRRYPTFWNAVTLSNPGQLNDVDHLLQLNRRYTA